MADGIVCLRLLSGRCLARPIRRLRRGPHARLRFRSSSRSRNDLRGDAENRWAATIVVLNAIVHRLCRSPVLIGRVSSSTEAGESRELVEMLYMDAEGMFNFVTGIMATYLFTFLLLRRIPARDGRRRDLHRRGSERLPATVRGGPAKVAVVSSGLMGMLSGSSISNVSTTGHDDHPDDEASRASGTTRRRPMETVASVGGGPDAAADGNRCFHHGEPHQHSPSSTSLMYSVAPGHPLLRGALRHMSTSAQPRRGVAIDSKEELPSPRPRSLPLAVTSFVPVLALMVVLLMMRFTPFFASAACVRRHGRGQLASDESTRLDARGSSSRHARRGAAGSRSPCPDCWRVRRSSTASPCTPGYSPRSRRYLLTYSGGSDGHRHVPHRGDVVCHRHGTSR